MKGILSGVFWGLVAVLAGLGVMSFIAPVPGTPPAQVTPAAPVEEQQAMAEPETATPPVISATAPDAPATTEDEAPVADAPAAGTDRPGAVAQSNLPGASEGGAPAPDTDSAGAPDVAGSPAALPAPDVAEGGASAPAGSAEPNLPRTAALTPPQDTPGAALAPPANPPAPDLPKPMAPAEKPDVPQAEVPAEKPELPQTEPPAPAPTKPEIAAPAAPAAPGAMRVPAPGQQIKTVPDVRVNRLPTVGGPAVEPAAQAPAAPAKIGALERYAAPFKPKADAPLFSVILIDEGGEGLDRGALTTFTFPVTFAIDASRPDAASAMRAYRDAGFEVVMIAGGLPQNATPKDLEVALSVYQKKLPEAVAVMDSETGGFHANRPLLRQLMGIVSETGQGVITYDKGLNTAAQIARAADVPAGQVFRTLDAQQERAATIRRYLDRAAFKAAQDGHVIMVGHTYPETVTALFSWALEGEGADLNIAPVSAILRGE